LHEVAGTRNQRAFQQQTKITMSQGSKRSNGPDVLHEQPPSLMYQCSGKCPPIAKVCKRMVCFSSVRVVLSIVSMIRLEVGNGRAEK
jgi:hypothetical protein